MWCLNQGKQNVMSDRQHSLLTVRRTCIYTMLAPDCQGILFFLNILIRQTLHEIVYDVYHIVYNYKTITSKPAYRYDNLTCLTVSCNMVFIWCQHLGDNFHDNKLVAASWIRVDVSIIPRNASQNHTGGSATTHINK